jgi:dephospho-CoA kinase
MQRDQYTREQVMERMSRQIDEELKMKLCDYVLVNDEQQLLTPHVLQLHETFLTICSATAKHK